MAAPAQAAQPIPAHCRVKLVLKPSSDSNINAELWLPTADWNGKFMAVGNGGFGGSIQGYGDMQVALRRGYATAGNDTGHTAADGPNGMFALGHPEKIVDFSHRAMHEMTVTSKRLIDEFYGKAPQLSYYKGCSTGGRQGVMAAQRFPDDYDGIIAGALANRHIHHAHGRRLAQHRAGTPPRRRIPPAKAEMVSKALMNACDSTRKASSTTRAHARFDFSKLACSGEDTENCLTAAQIKTVETFYGGVKNSKGELIFSGQALSNPLPALQSTDRSAGRRLRHGAHLGLPERELRLEDVRPRSRHADHRREGRLRGRDRSGPDEVQGARRQAAALRGLGRHEVSRPRTPSLYYESVVDKMGKKQGTSRDCSWCPAWAHCGGGVGPNTFDTIGTLEAWREKGTIPGRDHGLQSRKAD